MKYLENVECSNMEFLVCIKFAYRMNIVNNARMYTNYI